MKIFTRDILLTVLLTSFICGGVWYVLNAKTFEYFGSDVSEIKNDDPQRREQEEKDHNSFGVLYKEDGTYYKKGNEEFIITKATQGQFLSQGTKEYGHLSGTMFKNYGFSSNGLFLVYSETIIPSDGEDEPKMYDTRASTIYDIVVVNKDDERVEYGDGLYFRRIINLEWKLSRLVGEFVTGIEQPYKLESVSVNEPWKMKVILLDE